MLYAERVVELAKLGLTMGMAPRLSTNGYWAESPDRARSGVHRLRDEGFVHVWVSTDSFHEEFVPVERVHFLLRALRDEPMPFFVNLNYLFPTGTELGGLGIPQVRSELERDVRTLCIHREAARDVGNEQHGWCRVMDLGRGRRLLDSLGVAAEEARRVLQLYREIIERPNVLELSPSGDVIHRCRVLGNVDNGEFPGFLSQVS